MRNVCICLLMNNLDIKSNQKKMKIKKKYNLIADELVNNVLLLI